MPKELLLEIGTEEIPSSFVLMALKDIEQNARKLFETYRIGFSEIKALGTPRRLTLYMGQVEERQQDFVTEVLGPAKRVAYDEKGNPTKAAWGFARGQGVTVEELQIKVTDRGEYVCVIKREKGGETDTLLRKILPELITSLSFPKSMRWGESRLRFARPIHWILALFGGEVVDFQLEELRSGSLTYGHRFLKPQAIPIQDFSTYLQALREAYVIVDPDERRESIQKQLVEVASQQGGKPLEDEALLDTVTFLVEYPRVIWGQFDPGYLKLPRELLITTLREHQKYFSVVDSRGQLLPYFLVVSNMVARDMSIIRQGNERVLKARLADAEFFFHEDQKRPLETRLEDLKQVIFQEKLGTSYEKVQRFTQLALYLASMVDESSKPLVARTAQLCKADLVTEMVKEFPNLQGIMGSEYARLSGEPEEVVKGILEHYRPRFAGDAIPESTSGALVSLADKLDTIVGCFGINLIPTGSEDPYALRRQALGIIHIILGKEYSLSLNALISQSLQLLQGKLLRPPEEVKKEVLEFFKVRFINLLTGQGIRQDTIEAVLSVEFDDLVDSYKRILALAEFRNDPGFESLLIAFKRVINIIPKGFSGKVNPNLFERDEEKDLYQAVLKIKDLVASAFAQKEYRKALTEISTLRSPVDRFFTGVMVMVEDPEIRANRLALLDTIADLFRGFADFSKLVV
ncbi:MAG TPA: glycine--tRNA ligase subunit beta [Candidatus Limnocylindrales bacterium]|nr:glycine--tRNA ligase subunit beta [Candidatus Limnocylindrales bacterium]